VAAAPPSGLPAAVGGTGSTLEGLRQQMQELMVKVQEAMASEAGKPL
jgi:hypothetical protein